MRDIVEMLSIFKDKLVEKGIKFHHSEWINGNRNCIVFTDKGTFVLKHSPQWKMAGAKTKGLGPGAGMTFNLAAYLRLSLLDELPTMAFSFPETYEIYYQTWDEFKRLSEPTTQDFNGEEVRAILTKSLKRF